MTTPIIPPNEQLLKLLSYYIPNLKSLNYGYPELEVRFGTRGQKITQIEYDNVYGLLKQNMFNLVETIDRLDIRTKFQSEKEGVKESSIRIELHGKSVIENYCRTNKLNPSDITNRNIKFVQKNSLLDADNNRLEDAVFSDFNFIVSYKNEKTFQEKNEMIAEMLNKWDGLQKSFRLVSRLRFQPTGYSKIAVDMSVIRTSNVLYNGKKPETLYYYNIADSNVFTNPFSYEIECELNKININKIPGTDTPRTLMDEIHKISKTILCGLQNTKFPISLTEKREVLAEYSELLYPEKKWRMNSSNFIGPSSVTLQRTNIIKSKQEIKEPNILEGFAVTDKADGERHLLFVSGKGKIYLISTNMVVLSTGTYTKHKTHFNTILDGELIKHDKDGNFINRFAAFDIYFLEGKDIRSHPLIMRDPKVTTRINMLNSFAESIMQQPNPGVGSGYVSISVKTFYQGIIMDDCLEILSRAETYDYNIDGLIFTHKTYGVGATDQGRAGPLRLKTWSHSFKWKPSEFNTIDFLISVNKDSTATEIITPLYENDAATYYKTVVLKCGYSEKDHGYLDPVMDVIDKLKDSTNAENEEDDSQYKPQQFVPSDPVNIYAGLCYFNVYDHNNKTLHTDGPNSELIEDDTIVEFKFDKAKFDAGEIVQRCWIPIRNRPDKTAKYKRGEKMFGNAYHTANSNWFSIHNAVTRDMICGLEPIPNIEISTEVYYNNAFKKTNTEGLRSFHNAFVKKTLIWSVSKPGDKLIDYGCGKGGDLPKWIGRDLSFIFGIDFSKDNIQNRFDGACVRYLKNLKRHFKMPNALFVNGDCSKNIRSGDAVEGDINKEIIRAVFGQGDKTQFETHERIYESFGAGAAGFNVSSCQFAVHYFFKNTTTFHNFMRNVCECTAINGYFIGTCYDGHTIMKELRPYSYNDGIQKYENHELICEIIKRYDTEEFEDESTCLGKEILVYQDSINQYLPEYLVNFRYLERMSGLYGFKLLSSEECKQLKIPASEGMFKTLFRLMENNHNTSEYASALNMSDSERFVSFLNRYFIFKKVRDINAKTVFESFVQPFEQDETLLFEPQEQEHSPVQQVKPLHRKIILAASPEEGRVSPPKKSIRKIIPEGQGGPKTKKKNLVFNIIPPKETLVDVFERKKKEREERERDQPPPVVEQVVEPVVEQVVEPVVEQVVEPVVEQVVEPVIKPVVVLPEPVVEQVVVLPEPPKPATKKKSVIKFNFTKKAPTEKPP
jgi:hypothetical protein